MPTKNIQTLSLDEVYRTLKALELRIQPFMKKQPPGKQTLLKILFEAIAKIYLLGIAVGVHGENKRAHSKRKPL